MSREEADFFQMGCSGQMRRSAMGGRQASLFVSSGGADAGYTGFAMNCLFCKIVDGQIPSTAVFEDDLVYAFADLHPQAPVHVLIVPREHIASIEETDQSKQAVLGRLQWAAAQIARDRGLRNGYRIVVNTGEDGGQTVDHLHLHLLGGRAMAWPPG
jgi:histidine triad (HIT) family protein